MFHRKFFQQDINKWIIGYLRTFNRNNGRISKTIYKSIPEPTWEFPFESSPQFWSIGGKRILENIKRRWDYTIRLHGLGQGMKLLFPRVEFFEDVDPQQQRQEGGLQKGNCS